MTHKRQMNVGHFYRILIIINERLDNSLGNMLFKIIYMNGNNEKEKEKN